ncbi:hypothetical protein CF327_g4429 [Tilletia walkeri]|nr:hypothetical protein CF327_g4429 [Tilletia walkeri]
MAAYIPHNSITAGLLREEWSFKVPDGHLSTVTGAELAEVLKHIKSYSPLVKHAAEPVLRIVLRILEKIDKDYPNHLTSAQNLCFRIARLVVRLISPFGSREDVQVPNTHFVDLFHELDRKVTKILIKIRSSSDASLGPFKWVSQLRINWTIRRIIEKALSDVASRSTLCRQIEAFSERYATKFSDTADAVELGPYGPPPTAGAEAPAPTASASNAGGAVGPPGQASGSAASASPAATSTQEDHAVSGAPASGSARAALPPATSTTEGSAVSGAPASASEAVDLPASPSTTEGPAVSGAPAPASGSATVAPPPATSTTEWPAVSGAAASASGSTTVALPAATSTTEDPAVSGAPAPTSGSEAVDLPVATSGAATSEAATSEALLSAD